MDHLNMMRTAFEDELEKLSAVRGGRRPFTAQTLANASRLVKKGVMTKLSAKINAKSSLKPLAIAAGAGMVTGAYGLHKGKKAVEDYRTGRALRKAQAQGQYA